MRSLHSRTLPLTQTHQFSQTQQDPAYSAKASEQMPLLHQPLRLLRLQQVMTRTGVARTFIYDQIKKGHFPQPVKAGRASLWLETEIEGWIQALADRRDAA